ncbi:MAG: hypothetical protein K9I85_03525 [Saprospiraceae bacterium]|nr:hypothetical protein [Saprospiraceae bacterium]
MRNSLLFLVLLLILANGCRPSGEDFIISIPAEFTIAVREALGPSPRSNELVIIGLQDQPCTGTTLDYTWTVENQGGHLNIQGYTLPSPCTGPSKQVITKIPLIWKTPGEYPVTINLRNSFFNPGNLQISSTELTLKMYSQHGISVQTLPVQRLPDDLLWGYITSDDPLQMESIQEFLSQWPGESPLPLSGAFGHFSISSTGAFTMVPVAGDILTHPVTFIRKGIDRVIFTEAMNAFLQDSNGQIQGVLFCPEGQLVQ